VTGRLPPALPPQAFLVGLAGLPRMGPTRFRELLASRAADELWQAVVEGRVDALLGWSAELRREGPGLATRWVHAARRVELAELWGAHTGQGITVLTEDDEHYPEVFHDDPDAPAVLFVRGDPARIGGIRIAIVGTRRCTQYGREVASDFGRELAAAGARVVSGLALGIDAAAHAGALSVVGAPPIAVVGNGLDVVYPRRNAALYREVAERGVLLSEYPLGCQPRTWTFPARNRIIAALARTLVVVESQLRGGSFHTVDAAADRDVEIMAVPGSVRSPASRGPNELLAQGRPIARDAAEVLLTVGLSPARDSTSVPATEVPAVDPAALSPRQRALLDAVGWEPASLEQLLLRTHLGMADLHAGLAALEDAGWVVWDGSWVERRAGRAR
jgi:DNA processing protein